MSGIDSFAAFGSDNDVFGTNFTVLLHQNGGPESARAILGHITPRKRGDAAEEN